MSALAAASTANPFRLAVAAPFHLEATVRVLQRRPSNAVDVLREGRYLRVLTATGGLALVEVRNRGTIDAPDVRLSVLAPRANRRLNEETGCAVRRVLGLDRDPAALADLSAAAPRLRALLIALRGMRPPRFATLFESCASVVPFQQLSLESGIATLTRLVIRFGLPLAHAGQRWHAFPSAESVAEARLPQLRACGLSAHKAVSLRTIARAIVRGELTEAQLERCRTPEALRALQGLPGIGPWSAALILLRGLGRTDVFPPGDVAAAPKVQALLRIDSRVRLEQTLEGLGSLRGYLYYCALAEKLLERGLIVAAPGPTAARARPIVS